jgi:hypothetical protein
MKSKCFITLKIALLMVAGASVNVALKLCGASTLSWWWVLSPLWVPIAQFVFPLFVKMVIKAIRG